MIIYLLKFIACSGLLLLFYYGALQNDRLFRFNRFFLLAIIILALVVPITIVRTKIIEIPISQDPVYSEMEAPILDNASMLDIPTTFESTSQPSVNWENALWIAYLLVTSTLFFRFARNLHAILKLKRKSLIVIEKGIKIVLRNDIKSSFSFLNHMYTNSTRYEQGNLPIEIIEHEKHHIDQKHSYDIICIELLQCALWFNPFIYLIKGAIKLNHEFLADQHVLKDNTSVYDYQKILLDITRKQFVNTPAFASNLNYGFTKKRLNMMTKNTSVWRETLKQISALVIITATFWILGTTKTIAKDVAQADTEKAPSTEAKKVLETKPAPPKLILPVQMNDNKPKYGVFGLKENNRIRFKDQSGEWIERKAAELTESELNTFLYPAAEAQWYRIAPPVRKLNQEQLDDFLSPSKYGVWLDGKRIENEVLKNYQPEEIHHYNKSVLAKNAKNYGKHTFQVNLTTVEGAKTNSYYQTGWAPFHRQWNFTVKKPDIVPETAFSYEQGGVRPNSTVRYMSKTGQLVEKVFNSIEKEERKWLEHPDRKVEILLPKVEKAVFTKVVLDKYQDSEKYGIWVDDKEIRSSKLMNYAIDDFHHMRVFTLSEKSRAEKGYNYQVIFYTNDGANKLPSANDRWITVGVNYMIL